MSIVYAQAPDWGTLNQAYGGGFKFANGSIADLLNAGFFNIVLFLAGAAFLIYLVFGGISMMTSQGDPKNIAAARSRITYGLIGFIIVFAAYWIVRIIGSLLGIPDFRGIF